MIDPYDAFRTGLRFSDICAELRAEARTAMEQEGRRMFWTRNTVLGRWRQRKLEMYGGYVEWMRTQNAENGNAEHDDGSGEVGLEE